jgi:hypothetical protein
MKKRPISLLAVAAGGTLSFGIACAWAVVRPIRQPIAPFTITGRHNGDTKQQR